MASTSLEEIKAGNKPANPVAQFRDFLEKQKHQITAALPRHISPDRMIRLACTEFAKNPKLQECTPISVFGSIIQASQLGLEIGVLGQAYLVPYWNKKARARECQLIPGYKGLIALARRSGEVTSIETNIVYQHDEFLLKLGIDHDVKHVPYLDGERGAIRLVYAVARFKDGGYHFEWMTIAEVERIRAGSQQADSGPWVQHYEQMVRKTIIRRMANYLPMSIELSNALQLGDAAEAGHKATFDGEFIVIDEDAAGDEPEADAPLALTNESAGTPMPAMNVEQRAEPAEQTRTARAPRAAQQRRQAEPPPADDGDPGWTPSPAEHAESRQSDLIPEASQNPAPRRARNMSIE